MNRRAAIFCGIILLILSACRGGSGSNMLPPTARGRHSLSTAASVSQWTSGSAYQPTSITVSYPAAPAVGDVLVVTFWNNGVAGGNSNTYTPPSGWTLVDQDTSHQYLTYQSFSHVVAAGETNSYVFAPALAQKTHVWIAADIANAGGVDAASNVYTNGTTWTTPTVTPTQSADLALVFQLPVTRGVAWTNAPGWSIGNVAAQWNGEGLYQPLSSASPISETSTLSAASDGFSAIILLTPSGTQPVPSPTSSSTPVPTPVPPGTGPPSVAQWAHGSAYQPASITVSFPATPAAGHLLIVTFWNNGVAGGGSNTYTPPAGWTLVDQNTSHEYLTYQSFSHVTVAGETNSYTFAPVLAQKTHVWIAADIADAAAVDAANNIYTNGTTWTTPTVTPTQSVDLALAFQLPVTRGVAWTNSPGWGVGTLAAQWNGEGLYRALSSAAPISETSTLSASSDGFSAIILLTPSAGPTPPTPAYTDWSTFGYDLQRTGYNPNETTLSASNVTSSSLHQIWSADLGAPITAQPILAKNVSINGTATNVVYVGAENNTFYAVNADTGAILWKNTSLGNAVSTGCGDLPNGQFGITGTATYDRNAGVVYVADASDYVHALNMSTGAQLWSVNALYDPNTLSTVGTPSQDHIYGALTLNPNDGMLYAYTGSICDSPPWFGRLVAINVSTQSVAAAFFPGRTSSGTSGTAYCGGGIWGMGGASIDTTSNDVFVATGNVALSGNGCPNNTVGETYPYGDAVVQLDSQLNVISSATASVNGTPASNDSDYGATPMLYSAAGCSSLQVSAKNKNGYLYTYSVSSSGLTPEQQLHIGNTTDQGEFVGVPAYSPSSGLVYVGNPNANGNFAHGLNALQQAGGCAGLTLAWKASIGTANVTGDDNQAPTVANGVVYFTDGIDNQVWAFSASSGAMLWSSGTGIGSPCTSYGTTCGVLGAPMVDGRLFVGAWNGKLYAFGL